MSKEKDYHVLWTKNGCMTCKLVRLKLHNQNIKFKEINISEKPQYIDYFLFKGWNSVPRLTYKSKEADF